MQEALHVVSESLWTERSRLRSRALQRIHGNSSAFLPSVTVTIFVDICLLQARLDGLDGICMEVDDDLQLNLAGFEQKASASKDRSKRNRHTVSFKKQQKVRLSSSQRDITSFTS